MRSPLHFHSPSNGCWASCDAALQTLATSQSERLFHIPRPPKNYKMEHHAPLLREEKPIKRKPLLMIFHTSFIWLRTRPHILRLVSWLPGTKLLHAWLDNCFNVYSIGNHIESVVFHLPFHTHVLHFSDGFDEMIIAVENKNIKHGVSRVTAAQSIGRLVYAGAQKKAFFGVK